MIEIIAVLVILGVLAFLAVPRLTATNADVVAEAAILKSHIRYAQSLAMANNVAIWSLNMASSGYSLLKDGSAAPFNLPGDDSASHTFRTGVAITSGAGVLQFDDFGSPGAGAIVITLNGSEQVAVTANTGFTP